MPDPRPAKLLLHASRGLASAVLLATSALGQTPAETPAAPAPTTAADAPSTGPAVGDSRSIPLVSRDPSAIVGVIRSLLPEAVVSAAEGEPGALVVTGANAADLDRIEALVNALDRIDITGDATTFAPRRVALGAARNALVALLGTDGSIAGLALGADPRGSRLVLRGERARVELALEALAAIDADPSKPAAAPAAAGGELAIERAAHPAPQAALAAARALLPERVRREVRAMVSPDGRALILAGDGADLALWRAVLATTDRTVKSGRAARLVRLSADEPQRVIDEVRRELGEAADAPRIEFDASTREALLVGDRAAVETALGRIARISGGRAWERETALLRADGGATEVARLLAASVRWALPPRGAEPTLVEAAGELNAVLVSGEPGTIDLATLVLKVDGLAMGEARVACHLKVPATDAARLVDETRGAASTSLDAASSIVRADGAPEQLADFERALAEARGLRQANRIARIVPARMFDTKAMADEFATLLGAAVPVEPVRSVPMADVRALPSISALYIEGEPSQVALLGRIVAAREAGELVAGTPLRLLEIRCGNAAAVVRGLRERFDSRDEVVRRARPVLVEGDDAGDGAGNDSGNDSGNAIVVAMPPDMVVEVARAIDELDLRDDGAVALPREVFSSTLAQSDPLVVARALNGLFAIAPMPRDAAGHALPHLRERRELFASADPATRMVWVEAARERTVALDALVGQLDRLALPAEAEVRLFHLERGDITRVVQSLRDLAARGNLSEPAAAGAPRETPAIVIDSDPTSRTLIVVGDATAFAKTDEVLQQLGALAAPRGLRVIDAAGLDPEQLRTRALRLAELEPAAGDAPLVVASADAARGIVTAVGDEDALERFAAACRRLVPRAGDQLAASGVGLKQRSAASVASVLEGVSVGSARLAAIAAGTGDGAVIAGSRDAVIATEMLARALDSTSDPLPRMLATSPVRDATLPAEAIAEWFASRGLPQQQVQPAEVRATPDGDRLVVSAHLTPMGTVSSIVRDLGIGIAANDDATVVEVIPLRSARAETLAKLLDQCADSDGAVATVRADPTRNALVIAAPVWWCATLAILVESLDTADAARALPIYLMSAGGSDYRISVLPVRNAAVERAADLVRAVLGGTRVTDAGGAKARPLVSVGQDAEGRRLLVSGPSALCDLAEAIVARIDGADSATAPLRASAPWIECAEFALAHIDAEVASGIVESVLADRTRWPAELNDAVRDGARLIAPRAVADRAGGRIYVSAPPQLMSLARTAIERIDVDRAPSERWEMRVYPMSRAQVGPSAVAVRQAVEARTPAGGQPPRLLLDVEEDAEALVATGEPSWLDVVDSAVRSIEVRGPRDAVRVRVVSLAHNEAVRVAGLPGALLGDEQVKANGPDADAALPLRALADAKANAVALLATPGALDLAEEILVELDAAPDAPVQRSLRLYELQSGEAAVVAKSIVDLFETDDGTDPLPTVRVQPSRNSLLVRATDKQRVAIDGLVSRADATAPARARQVRTIALPSSTRPLAEIVALATRLRGSDAGVSLATDARANSVVAFGTLEAIEHTAWVLAQVAASEPEGPDAIRRTELPASAEPRAIAAQASAMFAQLGVDWRCGTGTAKPSAVITDRRDERAIASIVGADAWKIDGLLATLVQAQNAGPIALRQMRLERTDPARIGGLLRDEASRSDGLLRVVDDGASSTILLAGSPRDVEAAAAKASFIDRQAKGSRNEEVRLLPLRGLRAAETVELVGSVTALGGPKPWLVAEPVTNAIVLRGDAPELKPIGELIARLDDPMAKGLPPFEAVRIAHRTPGEVRTAVEGALAGIDASRRERLRLVADDALGFLFVRADETLIAEVRAAIAAADVPPPAEVPAPVDAPAPAEAPAPVEAPAQPTR